jgi:hypothetical protein
MMHSGRDIEIAMRLLDATFLAGFGIAGFVCWVAAWLSIFAVANACFAGVVAGGGICALAVDAGLDV